MTERDFAAFERTGGGGDGRVYETLELLFARARKRPTIKSLPEEQPAVRGKHRALSAFPQMQHVQYICRHRRLAVSVLTRAHVS